MKKDLTKIRKLQELDHLVQTKGDAVRIEQLRKELGMNIVPKTKREETQKQRRNNQLVRQYLKLRTMRLTEHEIAFVLGVSTSTLKEARDEFTDEEIEERLEGYAKNSTIRNYKRQLQFRWKDTL